MTDFSIKIVEGDATASRAEVMVLFNIPKRTLSGAIKKLKEDGLVIGRETAQWSESGKRKYKTETYNLDEIIAIGLRSRSENAIKFQRWAIGVLRKQLTTQQSQLDYFWDKEDQKDLY